MRRILSLLLVTMLALSTAGYAEPFLEEEVVFGDPVLENIMRKIVGGDGALTRKALAGVREVSIGVDGDSTPDSEKVHDLSGLEYCEDLFNLMPLEIKWVDGTVFEIDKVTDVRQAAAMKAGGQGDRYTVWIRGKQSYLFFERSGVLSGNNLGRWFVEAKAVR